MNRRFFLHSLMGLGVVAASPVGAAILYDFELGTQGWVNDSSVYYNDNFGVPLLSGGAVHAGAQSLSIPLDFTDKSLGNIVNDAVYVQPGGVDLSAAAGVTLYVRVGQGSGNGNPAYPLFGAVYVKTGASWDFKEGNQIPMARNRWHKLTIDFDAKGVANRNRVQEIGVHVYGSDFDRGNTLLFVDSVQSGLGDDLAAPSAPVGVGASDAGTGNRISLAWSAVAEADLDHYNIYRSTLSGHLSSKSLVTFVSAGQTTLADVSVVDGLSYFYQVTAVDRSGNEGAASTEVGAASSGATALSFPMKGITFASWQNGQWSGLDSRSSLDDLKATGATYVAVVVTQYMPNGSASVIEPDATKTASNGDVVSAIQKIHALGMKVMLKPHVDVVGGLWRGSITPSNVAAWFASYRTFINGYATLAQSNGVELFCVGTELKSMTQGKTADWTTVIEGVKARFSGSGGLTYAANANLPNDEFAAVGFWDQLDFVGVNLYFPLTAKTNPSSNEIKAAWSRNVDGFNMLQALSDFSGFTGKNILVTETGYQSADGTNITPYGVAGTLDSQEQKQTYEAMFTALNHRSWVSGLFLWVWDPNPNVDGYSDTGYSPQNKPALDVVTQNFGGEVTRSFYTFESGTNGWVADATPDFADNLAPPTTESQGGSMALRYALNLNNKSGGAIKDFAYIEPTLPKDLSGYTGLTASVMIPLGASIPAGTPATVALVIQSSSSYRWFQSNTFRNLVPGQWRDISIDFASATRYIGAVGSPGVPVEFLSDIRRMGISLSGAGSGSGSTIFYIDNVRARGPGSILGVSVGPNVFNLGSVAARGTVASGVPLQIENSGNVTCRYKLSCSLSSPGGWVPVSSLPGVKEYNLNARFDATAPASFDPVQHAVLQVPATSDSVRFAGVAERGDNVLPSEVRHLWLQLKAPVLSGAADLLFQTMTLAVNTEAQ